MEWSASCGILPDAAILMPVGPVAAGPATLALTEAGFAGKPASFTGDAAYGGVATARLKREIQS